MWSWSHTDEAYMCVMRNLHNRGHKWLSEVWAEWETARKNPAAEYWEKPGFNEEDYKQAIEKAKNIDRASLADDIYSAASEQADCTNGGWEAYVCPYHCHTVGFEQDYPWSIDPFV